MGNTLQIDKITHIITELSETTDINEKFLITEFNSLIELTVGNNPPYETIKDLFNSLTLNLTDENFINFSNNLISFIEVQSKEYKSILQPSLLILSCLIESIYSKYSNFKQILTFSLQGIKEDPIDNPSIYFPFNILFLCVSIINDQDLFSKPIVDKTKFEILFYAINLIYLIIGYPLNVGKATKNSLEYINMFKYIFYCESFLQKDVFELFYKKIFSIFLTYFDSLIHYNPGVKMSKKEQMISMLFNIIMFFCWDINQFFFDVNDKEISSVNHKICCFENEYNQITFDFLNKLYQNNQLAVIILQYQKYYQEELINLIHYNSQLFNEFIVILFNNYDTITLNFIHYTCLFLSYIFEAVPDFLEILCMKEFMLVMLSKISLMSLEEVILVNKIIMSENFIFLIKQIQEEEDKESMAVIEQVLFTALDLINNDKCPNCLVLYLFMIIYNITLFFYNMNKKFITEFIGSFKELIITKDQIKNMSPIDKCIIIKLFIEISFNFINSSELASTYLLSLIKISDELTNVYQVSIQNVHLMSSYQHQDNTKIKNIIESTEQIFKSIKLVFDKVNNKISQEGCDIKFSQDIVV